MRIKLILAFSLLCEKIRGFVKVYILKLAGCAITHSGIPRIGHLSGIRLYSKKSVLQVGKKCYVRKFCSIIVSDGKMRIGDNFFMNNYSSLNCMGDIEIGNNCLFGEGVKLYDHNYDYRKVDGLPVNQKGHRRGKIRVGNNCWIGSNSIVLMNVTIGDNVIIGANTVVHKDVPAGTILVCKQDLQSKMTDGIS